ncbi:hypothetical protein BH23PAT2_BH23PAT2_00840 [soil metagenome]
MSKKEAGKLLGITLVDHIVVTGAVFNSILRYDKYR